MIIKCPQCGQKTELEHVERGRHIECVCGARFSLDERTVVRDYSAVDQAPPEKIGPYAIERFIGRGGMGRIYKGTHPTLGIPVAVKTLLPDFANDAVFKARFIQSAKICAQLNHPGIVRVYDFGTTDDGTLYLVMEYIAGETLHDLLMRSGPLDPEMTAKIAETVCGGLEAAWSRGIVHRDIKPDNLMITAEGKCKLTDLGLAKYDPPPGTGKLAGGNAPDFASLGTPDYMAPEQALDAAGCDIRADIYSLGITLYQLLTGRLPFIASDRGEIRRMHREVEARLPGFYRPGIPMDLEYIVMRCIQKRRSDRYQTPADLHADLRAYREGRPLPSTICGPDPAEVPVPPQGEPVREKHRIRLSIAVIAAALVCAVAVFDILTVRPPSAQTEKNRGQAEKKIPADGERKKEPSADDGKVPADRDGLWKETLALAEGALRNRTGFAAPIRKLKSWENDEAPVRREEAGNLRKRLEEACREEIRQRRLLLDRQAEEPLAREEYEKVLRLYDAGFADLREESRAVREEIAARLEPKIREREERRAQAAGFLETKIVPLLASGEYDAAEKLYRSPDNPDRSSRAIPDLIRQCASIPVLFAERMRDRVGQNCSFRFRRGPLASRGPEGLRILSVAPPVIRVEAEGTPVFTIRDLAREEQAAEIEKWPEITPEARTLWLTGASFHDDPGEAARLAKTLPPYLRDPYMRYLNEWNRKQTRELFRNELMGFLGKAGYTGKNVPEPEQLLRIRLFDAVDWSDERTCSALYDKLDLLIRKYTGLPGLESCIDALRRIRSEMEERISNQTRTTVHEPVRRGE